MLTRDKKFFNSSLFYQLKLRDDPKYFKYYKEMVNLFRNPKENVGKIIKDMCTLGRPIPAGFLTKHQIQNARKIDEKTGHSFGSRNLTRAFYFSKKSDDNHSFVIRFTKRKDIVKFLESTKIDRRKIAAISYIAFPKYKFASNGVKWNGFSRPTQVGQGVISWESKEYLLKEFDDLEKETEHQKILHPGVTDRGLRSDNYTWNDEHGAYFLYFFAGYKDENGEYKAQHWDPYNNRQVWQAIIDWSNSEYLRSGLTGEFLVIGDEIPFPSSIYDRFLDPDTLDITSNMEKVFDHFTDAFFYHKCYYSEDIVQPLRSWEDEQKKLEERYPELFEINKPNKQADYFISNEQKLSNEQKQALTYHFKKYIKQFNPYKRKQERKDWNTLAERFLIEIAGKCNMEYHAKIKPEMMFYSKIGKNIKRYNSPKNGIRYCEFSLLELKYLKDKLKIKTGINLNKLRKTVLENSSLFSTDNKYIIKQICKTWFLDWERLNIMANYISTCFSKFLNQLSKNSIRLLIFNLKIKDMFIYMLELLVRDKREFENDPGGWIPKRFPKSSLYKFDLNKVWLEIVKTQEATWIDKAAYMFIRANARVKKMIYETNEPGIERFIEFSSK